MLREFEGEEVPVGAGVSVVVAVLGRTVGSAYAITISCRSTKKKCSFSLKHSNISLFSSCCSEEEWGRGIPSAQVYRGVRHSDYRYFNESRQSICVSEKNCR